MKQDDLDSIVRITDVAYQLQASALQALCNQEAHLRNELLRIDAMVRQNDLETKDLFVIQSLGADLMWQAWATRQKTQVNIRLAQIMAQKETVLQDLRRAFGRADVARRLQREATERERRARTQRVAER